MKKLTALLLTFLMTLTFATFTSCQLAKEDLETSQSRQVGCYVTTEYLSLFDMDSYLQDNANPNKLNGSVIDTNTKNNSKYSGKIYATFKDERYVFEDLDGFGFFYYDVTDEHGNICNVMEGGKEFFESNYFINSTDEGEIIDMSGTIKFLRKGENENTTFFFNPVYQTSDGEVYLTSGQGITSNGGGDFSSKIEQKSTINENNETTTYSMSCEVTLSPCYEVNKYKILEMDTDNVCIKASEYSPADMPKNFTPTDKTTYLIIETHNNIDDTNDSENQITREIISPKNTEYEQSVFNTMILQDNDVFTQGFCNIDW